MKKLLTLVCAALLTCGAMWAQTEQGVAAVGGKILYGSGIENMGLGAHFQYNVWDQIRGEVSTNFFFKKHHSNWMDVNVNGHYLIPVYQDKVILYPLAGLNYTMVNYKIEGHNDEENHVGLNVGGGAEYLIDDHFSAAFEYRHTIIRKVDQGVLSLGLSYRF
ncbi:MAG: porin family protein [Muribaculaceae bacterium]|nr:porin family protein [Muribaculaceae bacterium]